MGRRIRAREEALAVARRATAPHAPPRRAVVDVPHAKGEHGARTVVLT